MNQKVNQQPDVLEMIHRNISLSEEKRRRLRFEFNLTALSGGALQVLGSDEFIADLTGFVRDGSGQKDTFRQILPILGKAAVSPERTIRERTLAVLSFAALQTLQEQEDEVIVLLVHSLSSWLEFEQEFLPGFAVILKRIEELTNWLLRKSFWKDAEKSLKVLARIHCGALAKSSAVKSLVAKSLCTLATEAFVEKLADNYLQHDNEHDLCRGILLCLGRQSSALLLKRFTRSNNQQERQSLLNLVSEITGDDFPALIEDCLHHQPATEVLRDLISFVAERDEERLFSPIQQCFSHEDKRVQKEMIRCIAMLGGKHLKERLLAGLEAVSESLKISIIRLLVEYHGGDESVLAALCNLVENRKTFTPSGRQPLMGAVIIALRSFPHHKSIEVLNLLQSEVRSDRESDPLLVQIDQSLKILTPRLRHNRQFYAAEEEVAYDTDPLQEQSSFNKIAKIEEEVKKILRQGDGRGAGRLLYQHARAAGKERDFVTAEKLRDRILELDPMALADVMELGEWLEEQKNVVNDPLPLETWSNLGNLLSLNEFKVLRQVLRLENYRKGDIIVEAGESDETLYFLNSGHIGLTCRSGGDDRFLRRMKPGDVLGNNQFFAASVWTFSLKALSDVQVHLLNRDALLALADKFPGLEQKLHGYSAEYEKMIAQLLLTSGDDRREFPRYQLSWLVSNCLKDPYGAKDSKKFTGKLVDISRSGLSFSIKISSREHARSLLGREISSIIQSEGESIARCSGIVVGVRLRDALAKNFSIHVKLVRKMDAATFQQIVSLIE